MARATFCDRGWLSDREPANHTTTNNITSNSTTQERTHKQHHIKQPQQTTQQHHTVAIRSDPAPCSAALRSDTILSKCSPTWHNAKETPQGATMTYTIRDVLVLAPHKQRPNSMASSTTSMPFCVQPSWQATLAMMPGCFAHSAGPWANVGPILVCRKPSWGRLGPSEGHLGPS